MLTRFLFSPRPERHRSPKCLRTRAFRGPGGAAATTYVELSPPTGPVPTHPAGGATRGPGGTREELHRPLQMPPRQHLRVPGESLRIFVY